MGIDLTYNYNKVVLFGCKRRIHRESKLSQMHKTEKELNNDILKITATITEKFPELIKYVGEIPVKITYSGGDDVKIKNLEEYYSSLEAILKNYSKDHTAREK